MISLNLLQTFQAQIKHYPKHTTIFTEGETSRYYYQVSSGQIKTNNYNDEGKEFIQGIFTEGDSFGESTLLNGKTYPANAETITDAEVWILPKEAFFKMLQEHPETAIAMCVRLADRLYYKALIASEMASQDPEHRILKLIDFLKNDVNKVEKDQPYEVTLTRQQIADLTGLRVETVIRAVKQLEEKGALKIIHRKIFR